MYNFIYFNWLLLEQFLLNLLVISANLSYSKIFEEEIYANQNKTSILFKKSAQNF